MTTSLLDALKKVLPNTQTNLPLHEPSFNGNEWCYVKECIDTGWVSSVGKFVDRFEKDLADYTEVKHAIVTSNGTVALHMSFLLAGVLPNDEILTPTLSFVATCNAIRYANAIPHLIDSELTSLGVDAIKLATYLSNITEIKNNTCYNKITKRPIRALCVMHTFGHPVDLDALQEVAKHYHLILIEDAAEGLGSYYKGQHVGNHGLLSTLSFNGNKVVTTGGGGAILTNDSELAKRAKHLTTTAKKPHPWEYYHDELGYNYRLPNINAALGCAQLEQLNGFLIAKRALAKKYQTVLSTLEGVRFITEPPYAKSNYWLNALLLEKTENRDLILALLNKNGIGARPAWALMNTLPMYHDCPKMDLSCAEDIAARLINIPSSAWIKK